MPTSALAGTLAGLALAAAPVAAEGPHESAYFDYEVDLPGDWAVMTSAEIETPDELAERLEGTTTGEEMAQAIEMVGRDAEIYFYSEGRIEDTVIVSADGEVTVPEDAAGAEARCEAERERRDRTTGHRVRLYDCALTEVDGAPALRFEVDGYLRAERLVIHHVAIEDGDDLTITATASQARAGEAREASATLVEAIRFQSD